MIRKMKQNLLDLREETGDTDENSERMAEIMEKNYW